MEDPTGESGQTKRRSTRSDPRGRLSLFDSAAFPSIKDSAEAVYEYVESKAKAAGTKIPRNRGVPPQADPKNMLSVTEKAIVFLGRGIGIPWPEIEDRVCALREENDEPVPDRDFWQLSNSLIKRHSEIVGAIQGDLLDAMEAFSPMVGGPQRVVWRAQMAEFYRTRMTELAARGYLDEDTVKRIQSLDRSLRAHLDFFDDLGQDSDIAARLASPADRRRAQEAEKREEEIKQLYEDGEIDQKEKIKMLQEARHR